VTKTVIQWPLVFFKLLVGSGAATLAFTAVCELSGSSKKSSGRKTSIVAAAIGLGLMLAGAGTAVLQLGNPSQIMAVMRNLAGGSPISMEIVAFALCLVTAVAYLVARMRDAATTRVLAIAAAVFALGYGFLSGYSHMAMTGMPGWHNPALPGAFLLSSLLTGGLVFLAVDTVFSAGQKVTNVLVHLLWGVAVFAVVAEMLYGLTAPLGAVAWAYWLAVPLLGGLLPGVVMTLALRLRTAAWTVYAALACSLVGAFALRMLVWMATNTALPGLIRG
jgi:formate-dependent nitrite reductase membrane component NrfD